MSTTRENPRPPVAAPTEPTGALVGESSSLSTPAAAAPRVRGFAPPITDTAPTSAPSSVPPPAPVVALPRLWLTFHSDGTALRCTGSLQREHLQRVQFDAADPVVAQAYLFFVRKMIAELDGLPMPSEPPKAEPQHGPGEPEQREPAAAALEPEPATRPDVVLPSPRAHAQRRSQPAPSAPAQAEEETAPPTNPNPDKPK